MKTKIAYRTVAAVAIGIAALSGCKKSESPSSQSNPAATTIAFNASCPIEPERGVSLKSPTVEYKSMTIGFCCEDCPKKWAEWPDTKKDEFIAAQKKALEAQSPIKTPDTDH